MKKIITIVLLCVIWLNTKLVSGQESNEKPNILFIYTDQQTVGLTSIEGNKLIQTPNIDRIAREGAMFPNAFVNLPSCSPSRASLVTGTYSWKHKVYDNEHPNRGIMGIVPEFSQLSDRILHDDGYVVGHRGKWHIGNKKLFFDNNTTPPEFDFPYAGKNYPYKAEMQEQFPWDFANPDYSKKSYFERSEGGWVKGKAILPTQLTADWQKYFFNSIKPIKWGDVGKNLVPLEKWYEWNIVKEVCEFIDENKSNTWAMTMSISPPHDPWSVPDPYYTKIAKHLLDNNLIKLEGDELSPKQDTGLSTRIGRKLKELNGGYRGVEEYVANYLALVAMTDVLVGKVLDKLDDLGLANNTIVVFTSDHGDMKGMHYNVGKINEKMYNRLFNVPLFFRYPDKIPAGQIYKQRVSNVDIMPTILDFSELAFSRSNIDGKSFKTLLEGEQQEWRDLNFIEDYHNANLDTDFNISTDIPDSSDKESARFSYTLGIVDDNYKYCFSRFSNGRYPVKYTSSRFIDYKEDLTEVNNLINSADKYLIYQYQYRLKKYLEGKNFPYIDEIDRSPFAPRDHKRDFIQDGLNEIVIDLEANIVQGGINLKWEFLQGAQITKELKLYRINKSGAPNGVELGIFDASISTFKDTTATPDRNYVYLIEAYDSLGVSGSSRFVE